MTPIAHLASHLVHVRDGRHLLVRRAGTPYRAGYLSCVAGRVEPGETPRSALVREVAEEIGLVVRADDLAFRTLVHNRVGSAIWQSFFFELTSLPAEPTICEPAKIAEIGYFDLAAVAVETVPYVHAALTRGVVYLEMEEAGVEG
ncbi:MAG: NUDIX domain-containing protein [Salinarimonas sp.]